MPRDNDWTKDELDYSIKIYLEMLSKQVNGIPFNKSTYRKESRASALSKRSDSSFEFRMRNISAVLHSLGQQYIKGYLPAKNVGTNTAVSILESLERHEYIDRIDFEPTSDAEKLQQRTERIRKRINLENKPTGQLSVQRMETFTTVCYRDPAVRAWVLEFANGKCEACNSNAPFVLSDGYPFLEVHHMIPLAMGGPDTIENAVALCPNCHRRSHLAKDRNTFNNEIYSKILRLAK